MTTTLPCPFCSYDDPEIDEIDSGIWAICCPECNTIGPVARDIDGTSAQTPEQAIAAWNQRMTTTEIEAC